MENTIVTDLKKGTISGTFHVERGGGHSGGSLVATIVLNDMTPGDIGNIQELIQSISKDIIHGIAIHAVSQ